MARADTGVGAVFGRGLEPASDAVGLRSSAARPSTATASSIRPAVARRWWPPLIPFSEKKNELRHCASVSPGRRPVSKCANNVCRLRRTGLHAFLVCG